MSSSNKIFRPWDIHEDPDRNESAANFENNDIDITDITDEKITHNDHIQKHTSHDLNSYKCRSRKIVGHYDSRDRNNGMRQNSELFRGSRPCHDACEESIACTNNRNVNETIKETKPSDDKEIRKNIDDLRECTNNISDSQSKSPEKNSHRSHKNSDSSNGPRHHRRHSRKHRSRSFSEKVPEIHISSTSPSNTTDTISSSTMEPGFHPDHFYQAELNFSNIEKQFYPDFRSLEFLPEDILDPILMSGLPLGAPLDPYWSNLALEYFKSHEASLKSKQQRPKKFNCPHCNVAFSNNGQLKGHIRIHTGKMQF